MKRTMMLTALCTGAWAGSASAGEPRLGLEIGTAQGTTVGALVRVTDRVSSRAALRFPSWGGVSSDLDVTFDVLRGRPFVPYLGAGVELVSQDDGRTEQTESRALVGVRHHPTPHVRLFGEAVWHRPLGRQPVPLDEDIQIRLGVGVSVLF
jgi:Surface antigen